MTASLEDRKRELASIQRRIDIRVKEREQIEIQQKELDLAIRKLYRGNAIQTVEQLSASRQAYDESLSLLQTQIGELNEDVEYLKVLNQQQTELVGIEEEHQLDRIGKVARGQLQVSVIGINSEWGFVIINAGESHGIGTSSGFLVKRGNKRITRLTITHLRKDVCLCSVQSDGNIDADHCCLV